ncbi:hypothetical protein OG301_39415 (plasmid) [Streptomyces platensis]|uniref:hypothetical protein n=1 Tax=Streptomyces platensis TaxID=58346 RepID=UPI002ED66520|nr:hypothetical protein OG301_39415 [Streptomyces platensis]
MLVRAEQLELPVGDAREKGILQEAPQRNTVMAKAAARRLKAAAVHREERAKLAPEQVADRRTSMADARIALCVTQGTALDDIDPASGYSLNWESYESVRQSWRNQAKQPGWSECYRRDLEKAIAFWSEHRPEFTESDDWLEGLVDHYEGKEGDA